MKKILLAIMTLATAVSCCNQPKATAESQEASAHTEWSYDAVIYEMNVRQYTPEGTFAAAAEHLPRLKEMGVDVVWMMPVYPIGVKERKGTLGSYYAISDYCATNPEFGTLEDFDAFLKKAHDLGLKVILDWVANHTSPDAKWIVEQPADWYVRDENGNTIVQYDWTDIAKLNYDNHDMRKAMEEAMRFWLERGVDGLRCDMACEVPMDFWRDVLPRLRKDYPDTYFLAEGENVELHTDAFDSSYSWELHHLMNSIARGEKGVKELTEYLAKDAEQHPAEAMRLMFTSNHDENSWAGTEFERMGEAYNVMAMLTFTLPKGQPLIYTGQEMGWNKRFEFFEKDHIPAWEQNDYADTYKRLCQIRHTNPALKAGEKGGEFTILPSSEGVFKFSREVEGNKVVVVANLTAEAKACDKITDKQTLLAAHNTSEQGLEAWGWMIYTE